jgi:hypothetical protein
MALDKAERLKYRQNHGSNITAPCDLTPVTRQHTGMKSEAFIKSIKTLVHDSGVRSVVETLEHPAGRRPPQRLVELSDWFRSLSASDKARVEQVIQLGVHSGVFGLLAVLDSVRSIEDGHDKGSLELSYLRGGERDILTEPSQEMLHDIYQSHIYEQVFGSAA